MKIKLSLFLAVLVFASAQAQGAIFQGSQNDIVASGSAVEENNIINIRESYLEDDSLRFFAVSEGINISELCPIACVVSDTYTYYHCQIDWSDACTSDTSTVGKIKLKGKIIPPDGFQFNTDAVVEATALIYDNDNPTEELADITYDNDITIVHLGEDVSSYLDNAISLSTKSGDMFNAKIEWHNTVAPNTMGKFQTEGTIILPKGIKAENENDLIIHRDFYAMKDDKIYIEPFYTHGGNIIFPWLYNARDTENVKIQYSYDNKSWLDSEEDEYGYVADTYLLLFSALLEPHKNQYFRLFYNGEYTNTVLINTDVDPVIIDGDHDGGDNYEQEFPPLIVESNTSRSGHGSSDNGINKENNNEGYLYSDSTKRLEISDLNTTVISGKRINDLAEINNKIIFEKKGISLELNKNFIEENNIKDEDTVSVTIEKGEKDDFSIDVSINNKAVKKIPDTIIRFPKTEETDSVNNKENNTNQLIINEPGTYSPDNKGGAIKIDENSITDNSNDKSYINISYTVMAFSIIIAVLIYILWRSFNKYAKQK